VLADTGHTICNGLGAGFQTNPTPVAADGIKNAVASDLRRGNPSFTFEQTMGWVQAAIDNICPNNITGWYF
jgi:hypothetical protein